MARGFTSKPGKGLIGLQKHTKETEIDIFWRNNKGKTQKPWQKTKGLLSLFFEIKKQYLGILPWQGAVTIGQVKVKEQLANNKVVIAHNHNIDKNACRSKIYRILLSKRSEHAGKQKMSNGCPVEISSPAWWVSFFKSRRAWRVRQVTKKRGFQGAILRENRHPINASLSPAPTITSSLWNDSRAEVRSCTAESHRNFTIRRQHSRIRFRFLQKSKLKGGDWLLLKTRRDANKR